MTFLHEMSLWLVKAFIQYPGSTTDEVKEKCKGGWMDGIALFNLDRIATYAVQKQYLRETVKDGKIIYFVYPFGKKAYEKYNNS